MNSNHPSAENAEWRRHGKLNDISEVHAAIRHSFTVTTGGAVSLISESYSSFRLLNWSPLNGTAYWNQSAFPLTWF